MKLRDDDNPQAICLLDQVFSIPIGSDEYLIYTPLQQLAFVGNAVLVNEVFEHCRRNGTPASLKFTDSSLTKPTKDKNRLLALLQPQSPPMDEYDTSGLSYDSVILFTTNQCNLRCSYCYACAGDYPNENMTWEIAQSGIDFVVRDILRSKKRSLILGFHGGGEPTLNWDVLQRSVKYARDIALRNSLDLLITGAFNAYWPDHVVRFVLDNFTELSLSFDGLPHVQNGQRPTITGKGSYECVTKTLRALDLARFRYGIRMTITNDSVFCMEDSIRHICERFNPHTIQVEPVFPQGRASGNAFAINNNDVFISQFIRSFWIARSYNIRLFYSGARPEVITQRFCLAACRALIVTPDGNVTTCFEVHSRRHPFGERFIVGNYDGRGDFQIDTEKVQNFIACKSGMEPDCRECFCKWHCAGDCATKVSKKNSFNGVQNTDRCFVTQELTKFLILDNIKNSGGLIWHGQPDS